ncbi:glutamate--cysteine ligase [Rothia sp. P100]|uniref:glutamate--cysteine ligase n=1 Tax=Rothia sp. P100 TaxID=2939578 RepID=UPI00204045B5|nr:glutamate--cysteine ligase [Rothia sp. P100]MCM3509614.1 glutamate--cysteine ligase [Rothia sp. P100]
MMPFNVSEQSTIGVEWEIALVDPATRELSSRAPEVLTALKEHHPQLLVPGKTQPHITGEFLDNTVELVTGICRTPAEASDQLREAASVLKEVTDSLGLGFFSAGTHPFSRALEQPVADKDRYQRVLDRSQFWGKRQIIYGVHVHTGVDSRDKALPVLNGLTNFYPHLLALSASSPFWEGEDTGFASHRAQLFQQLPTSGLPFIFETWEDYESYLGDLLATGVIDEPSENRWDVRPVPGYGTVEMRAYDGLASVRDIAALTAFTQCLVEWFSRQLDAGGRVEPLHPWHAQENKWRAARYGTEAIIIMNNRNEERLVTEDVLGLLDKLEPVARDLGSSAELADVERMCREGAGYQRQRRVAAEHRGDLRAVVDDLVAQAQEL